MRTHIIYVYVYVHVYVYVYACDNVRVPVYVCIYTKMYENTYSVSWLRRLRSSGQPRRGDEVGGIHDEASRLPLPPLDVLAKGVAFPGMPNHFDTRYRHCCCYWF